MLFSLIILVVLWLLQFALLKTFQVKLKTHQIEKMGQQITEFYTGEGFNDDIQEYAFKHNLRIILLDERGFMISNSDGFSDGSGSGGIVFPPSELAKLQELFNDSNKKTIIYTDATGRREMTQITYVSKLESEEGLTNYLYISSPVPPVDTTLTALRTQFFIITIILLILSLIVAQLISQKMSVPIIKLTKSAEKLAKGDLDVDFYDGGYTEIHKLSRTLHYATSELSKLDHYRKEFIANVSHDLKTPLTVIKVYGEMILDVSGDDPEKRNEHCKMIVKEADWLAEMVNEILELSKLQSDNVKLDKKPVDLGACLKTTLEGFKMMEDKEGYNLKVDTDENVTVLGSEQYLRRVLYNLISNAINYTGEDKLVEIRLMDQGSSVRFEVKDTGKGIPPEKLESIWERYYKSDETHMRAVVGTGLGLSIVKNALELHGARYGVDSKENQGSTFWFEIEK